MKVSLSIYIMILHLPGYKTAWLFKGFKWHLTKAWGALGYSLCFEIIFFNHSCAQLGNSAAPYPSVQKTCFLYLRISIILVMKILKVRSWNKYNEISGLQSLYWLVWRSKVVRDQLWLTSWCSKVVKLCVVQQFVQLKATSFCWMTSEMGK